LISIVVPVLNEEECVGELARRVRNAFDAVGARHELIFVNDGSRDGTREQISQLRDEDPRVKTIHFTRSFGHQAALAAGLRFAKGDAVVTMDGDLQHPPEVLPRLIEAWRHGADVVYTVRRDPKALASGFKRASAHLFYRLQSRLSQTPVDTGGADFRLLDRRAVDAFKALEEHVVFVRGLVPWLGFRDARVEYDVQDRFAGRSKFSLRSMLDLALEGIVPFSVFPLRLIALLGAATALLGVMFGVFALFAHLGGRAERGWTSIVGLVLIFGGVQLLSLGVVSEYVGRIYEEVKRRPRYVIDDVEGIEWP
jgi:dolichol-phosphate mannosyltransferase